MYVDELCMKRVTYASRGFWRIIFSLDQPLINSPNEGMYSVSTRGS